MSNSGIQGQAKTQDQGQDTTQSDGQGQLSASETQQQALSDLQSASNIQKAIVPEDRANLTAALSDQSNIGLIQRWGESSKERRKGREFQGWAKTLSQVSDGVCELASKYRDGQPCQLAGIFSGSFNFCIKVQFESDLQEWVMRFPLPGKVMFIEEKLRNEVATMRYIKEKTSIPVPEVMAWGLADDNPTGLGPFLITRFVEGTKLSDLLKADSLDQNGNKILSSDISDSTLELVYRQIANILLELSEHSFDKIGALSVDDNNEWSIGSRPLSLPMNEIARCGDVYVDSKTCSTTADYFLDLAEQSLQHYREQRNSADSPADARLKYTSRHLLRTVTPSFVSRKFNQGPFKLFGDDFRPSNILVDKDLKITAVIDWEWWYAAPYQFLYAPPRWLLLNDPWSWTELDEGDLLERYLPKLELFLGVLAEQERSPNRLQQPDGEPTMSMLMRQSMEDKTFWFNEAIRDSWDADRIYLERLDDYCFGSVKGDAERIEWLSRLPLYQGMEDFVSAKMEQLQCYKAELGVDDDGPEKSKMSGNETSNTPLKDGSEGGRASPSLIPTKLRFAFPWKTSDNHSQTSTQTMVNISLAIGTVAALASSFTVAWRLLSK
ncbi:MAG: SF3a splicing factor complex subunit [Chaenotheca gracillima]|nr:MAG: SF3a splicing factor complex subunit [Chaenotheca gracillima]